MTDYCKNAIFITDDMGRELLEKYAEMRRKINFDIESIQGITRAFYALDETDKEDKKIYASVLAQLCRVLDRHATSAWKTLDDFVPTLFTQDTIAKRNRYKYCVIEQDS